MKKTFFSVITLMLALCCIAGCTAKEPVRPEQEIIHDLIYSFDARQGNPDTEQYLSELKSVNEKKAAVWEDICDTWSASYQDGYLNPSILPDGLPQDNSLAIVVLGYQLNSDGTMQDELIGRLETAYDCAMKYPNAYIVLTGGGTARNNPNITEADAMADWLRQQGMARDRLIIENRSLNTLTNASNSFRILERDYPSVTSLAIVTSDYHIPWGVTNFEGVIQYEAYKKDTAPQYKIISNAGYVLEKPTYSYESINGIQKDQLWRLEKE